MSDMRKWQAGILYLCEEKNVGPDRVLLEPQHHDFKATASGGAVWTFVVPDVQFGGLADRSVVLDQATYEAFLERANGGPLS